MRECLVALVVLTLDSLEQLAGQTMNRLYPARQRMKAAPSRQLRLRYLPHHYAGQSLNH